MAAGIGGPGRLPELPARGEDVGAAGGDGPPVDIRGAIYIPTRAYNIYQMWHFYDPEVVERD